MDNTTGPADPGNQDGALAGAMFMVQMGARVLPVARGTKRASLKDWSKQASDDLDMVIGWAQHHPGCNWAMLCDRIAVFDVDKHPNSPDGHAALAEIEAKHGKIETWLVHTPQNGRHYYFSQPEDRVPQPQARRRRTARSKATAVTFSCPDRARRTAPIDGTPSFARTTFLALSCPHTCMPLLPACP